jgi:hypothetical protein
VNLTSKNTDSVGYAGKITEHFTNLLDAGVPAKTLPPWAPQQELALLSLFLNSLRKGAQRCHHGNL